MDSYELVYDEMKKVDGEAKVIRVSECYTTNDYKLMFEKAKERVELFPDNIFVAIIKRNAILGTLKEDAPTKH